MSKNLDEMFDHLTIIFGTYILEVSSPGISSTLTTDRDFLSFKGFPVIVETVYTYKNRQQLSGRLQGRDEESLFINQKGNEARSGSKKERRKESIYYKEGCHEEKENLYNS